MDDPIAQVRALLEEGNRISEAPAMTLATASPDGRPSARVVLLRGLDERGLTFFTNRTSRKGDDLESNPQAAVVLHWWELGRQLRIEGPVERTTEAESQEYWATRPRESDRGMVVAAVAAAGWTRRPRGTGPRDREAVRRQRRSAPAVLGRLPAAPGEHRVLDAPRRPPPRPRALRAGGQRLAARLARTVTVSPARTAAAKEPL